jgi:hypothetical protein
MNCCWVTLGLFMMISGMALVLGKGWKIWSERMEDLVSSVCFRF